MKMQAKLFSAKQRSEDDYRCAHKALTRLSEDSLAGSTTRRLEFIDLLGENGEDLQGRLVKANLVAVTKTSVRLASRAVAAYVMDKLRPPLTDS